MLINWDFWQPQMPTDVQSPTRATWFPAPASRGFWLAMLPVGLVLAAFCVSLPNTPLHPDDLRDIQRVIGLGYLATFANEWLCDGCSMYRPLLAVSMKVLFDTFGLQHNWLRLAELCLVMTFLLILFRTSRTVGLGYLSFAIVVFHVMGSPFLYHPFTYWGNISALLVINCFALCCFELLADHNLWTKWLIMFVAFSVAVFAMEIGMVLVVFMVYFVQKRKYILSTLFLTPLLIYLASRSWVTGSIAGPDIFLDTGFLSQRLSTGDVKEAFPGWRIYYFHAYTSASQILAVVLRIFKHGQLYLSIKSVPIWLSTAVIGAYLWLQIRKRNQNTVTVIILILAIVLNGLISHKYARDRIMAVGAAAYALLLMLALRRLESDVVLGAKPRKLILVALYVGWLGMSVDNIISLNKESAEFRDFFARHEEHPSKEVTPELYDEARQGYIRIF
jgi:hypothetical protein